MAATKKAKYGVRTIQYLKMLEEAKKNNEPFQEAGLDAKIMEILVARDLITRSPGIDGTVKYQITGRGKELLRNGDYILVQNRHTSNGTRSSNKTRCEDCLHRYVLDQVRERCADVEDLFVAMDALSNLKERVNGGSVQENMAAVRELYAQVEAVETIMARLGQ